MIHAGWWNRENPYEMISGAAIRIVVDMSDLKASKTFHALDWLPD